MGVGVLKFELERERDIEKERGREKELWKKKKGGKNTNRAFTRNKRSH